MLFSNDMSNNTGIRSNEEKRYFTKETFIRNDGCEFIVTCPLCGLVATYDYTSKDRSFMSEEHVFRCKNENCELDSFSIQKAK